MWLRYHNGYGPTIWLAVGYYSPGCSDGGDWAKKGWWRLDAGQTKTVLWTTNAYSTFYAEAEDGAFWAGPYVTSLPFSAFDWCWNTGSSNAFDAGMRLVHASNAWFPWVGTVNLV